MRRQSGFVVVTLVAALFGAGLVVGVHLGISAAALAGLMLIVLSLLAVGVNTRDLSYYAVGLFLLTVTWNGVRIGGGASGNGPMALAALAVIADAIIRRTPLRLPRWLLLAMIGFALSALLVAIFPPSQALLQRSILTETNFLIADGSINALVAPRKDVSVLLLYELILFFVPLTIAAVGSTPERLRRLIDLWSASAVINALVATLDYTGVAHLAPVAIAQHRSSGLTIQPNYLALTCVLALPTAMMLFTRPGRAQLAAWFAVPMLLAGAYASGSRAGAVAAALAVAAMVTVVPSLRQRFKPLLPVVAMVLIAVLVFTNTGHKILQQIRIGGPATTTSGSDNQRATAAAVAFADIRARPLEGIGFSVIADAHDIYLEFLAAGGIIALLAFFTFIGGLVSCLARTIRGPLRDYGLALGIGVFCWLANGVFDNQVADKYLYVVPGLLFAAALASDASAEAPAAEESAEPVPAGPPGVETPPRPVAVGA